LPSRIALMVRRRVLPLRVLGRAATAKQCRKLATGPTSALGAAAARQQKNARPQGHKTKACSCSNDGTTTSHRDIQRQQQRKQNYDNGGRTRVPD